jgi:hypothetical protein
MNMFLNRQGAKVAKKKLFCGKTWRSWRLGG